MMSNFLNVTLKMSSVQQNRVLKQTYAYMNVWFMLKIILHKGGKRILCSVNGAEITEYPCTIIDN